MIALDSALLARLMFQCSSASRKFLNGIPNSSDVARLDVSVLFSEPKIPQFRNIGFSIVSN